VAIEIPHRWTHAYAQWLLLDIGRRTGHDIWIAPGDREKTVGTVRLGDFSLDRLPSVLPEQARRIVEQIDVVWFRRGTSQPRALFEVEHSTSILSGLLRMNDLVVTAGSALGRWRMSIVAPARRLSKFEADKSRPTFRATGLANLCTFLSYDELLRRHEQVKAGMRRRSDVTE
jgi:type II restriction enzyme